MVEKIKPKELEDLLTALAENRSSEEAWAALYRMVWPFVIATIYRSFGGNSAGVEDVAQEVFVRLIRFCDFAAFPSSAAFLGYLHAICRNAARDALNIRPRPDPGPLPDIPSVDMEQAIVDNRLILEGVFKDMTKDEAELAQYILDGYSLREIATMTQQSYGTLAVRFHRLKSKLRAR